MTSSVLNSGKLSKVFGIYNFQLERLVYSSRLYWYLIFFLNKNLNIFNWCLDRAYRRTSDRSTYSIILLFLLFLLYSLYLIFGLKPIFLGQRSRNRKWSKQLIFYRLKSEMKIDHKLLVSLSCDRRPIWLEFYLVTILLYKVYNTLKVLRLYLNKILQVSFFSSFCKKHLN